MYLSDVFTIPANLAGVPAISVPCGLDSGGLPIGVQLTAPALGEPAILRAAHALEGDLDLDLRPPILLASESGSVARPTLPARTITATAIRITHPRTPSAA